MNKEEQLGFELWLRQTEPDLYKNMDAIALRSKNKLKGAYKTWLKDARHRHWTAKQKKPSEQ